MVESGTFAAPGSLRCRAGLRRVSRGRRFFLPAAIAAIVLVQAASMFFAPARAKEPALRGNSPCLAIVAAENFYQDIASQIAGPCASVKSVLSDPNIDPHEYEPTVNDAMAVAAANLVIENGAGYDDWMKKLLSASPKSGRLVINAYAISPVKLPENEHVWYSMEDMKAVAAALAARSQEVAPVAGGPIRKEP